MKFLVDVNLPTKIYVFYLIRQIFSFVHDWGDAFLIKQFGTMLFKE